MQGAIDFKYTTFLQMLQFADSALPIGSAAHSFGLETLVSEGLLSIEQLETFLRDYLVEAGALECQFCQRGHQLASRASARPPHPHYSTPCPYMSQDLFITQWLALNERLSAYKTVRESRLASASLGRRFLQLVHGLDIHPLLPDIMQAAKSAGIATHFSIAFGLIGGLLAVDATMTGLAYLQQSLSGLVFACQRLMPLGQHQASKILWHLQPTLLAIIKRSEVAAPNDDISSFTPLVDIGSMGHSALTTRLFIS